LAQQPPAAAGDSGQPTPLPRHPTTNPQTGGDDDPETAALRARAADLRARLEEKNSLIKAAIDRLRLLLDALCMWDSSRRELAAAAVG
jgi:hypothetical protein